MPRFSLTSLRLLPVVGHLMLSQAVSAQDATLERTAGKASEETASGPVIFTTQQDHQNMLQQLGIRMLRPGRNGDEKAPNGASYDEGNANPWPDLPDVMKLASGEQVTTQEQWQTRRAEIVELLETESAVNAKRVGIAGVSRYGKAALVAMAFDQRFGMGRIASSGAGGTKLNRRNFGESLENLAGSGEYHWMAGNYIKYAAEESSFGRRTADDLPVDSHMTLALCAPRLTFISHGIPEKGDANWLDHQGSFMAAIAAQPVFRLLEAHDLGRSDDHTTEKMPAVNVDMLDGELARRQHDGSHTDEPNIAHFIRWADNRFTK